MSVLLQTNLGDIVIDLEVSKIPNASRNFMELAELKFLNNLTVSKVEKDYLCVFGSANEDPGCAEYRTHPRSSSRFLPVERNARVKHSKFGSVGMVNGGQSFYITLKDGPMTHLDVPPEKTTIIGYVEDGLDILEKINSAICDTGNIPYNTIRIRHCAILDDDNFKRPSWYPRHLPSSPEEVFDEILGEVEEEDAEVLEERQKEAVAKARELELELMGDIPAEDIRPPNNVLFVCQLNPITEDEDLKTVFSRFGEIKKCEIIRDYVTGDSLQYAFVEFEKEESCNKAYVSMQNVLIDDKRIKVDFSQSVSKLWNEARRGGVRKQGVKNFPKMDLSKDRESRHYDDHRHNERRRSPDRHRRRSPDRYRRRSRSYDRDYRRR